MDPDFCTSSLQHVYMPRLNRNNYLSSIQSLLHSVPLVRSRCSKQSRNSGCVVLGAVEQKIHSLLGAFLLDQGTALFLGECQIRTIRRKEPSERRGDFTSPIQSNIRSSASHACVCCIRHAIVTVFVLQWRCSRGALCRTRPSRTCSGPSGCRGRTC